MSRYVVRAMRFEDIDAVSEVERECFSTPWPTSAYRRELRDPRLGRYLVLSEVRDEHEPPVASSGDRLNGDGGHGVRRAVEQLLRPFGRASLAPPTPSNERIVGFAGMWLMLDEAHVTTIGVKTDLRGKGFGEVLFATLLQIATEVGARRATLEVRISNQPAQALYRKYGFHEEGIRRRYYSDNNEDALIMWSDTLTAPDVVRRYHELRAELAGRLGDLVEIQRGSLG